MVRLAEPIPSNAANSSDPLLLWRLMTAIGSDFAIVRNPEAFACTNGCGSISQAGAATVQRSADEWTFPNASLEDDSTEAEDV